MALGEDRDRIDMRRLQRVGEILGVEGGTDPRDMFRGVEVEMDLAVAERLRLQFGHDGPFGSHSLVPERVCAPAAKWRWKMTKTASGTIVVTSAATERKSQLRS